MADATEEKAATLLQLAVTEVLKPVQHLEEPAEFERIREMMHLHFKRGSRKMSWELSFLEMADAFADHAIGAVFGSFSSKEWLPEIDFVVLTTVAMRERYPIFSHLSHFDKASADACEKALDLKRAQCMIWELAQAARETKMSQTRIHEALDAGRQSAMPLANKASVGAGIVAESMDAFMVQWITETVNHLKGSSRGHPEKVVTSEGLTNVFKSLCEKGTVPKVLTNLFGQPPADWPIIKSTIEEAYGEAPPKLGTEAADEGVEGEAAPPTKRSRTRAEGYGTLQPGADEQSNWQNQVRRMPKKGFAQNKKKPAWNTW